MDHCGSMHLTGFLTADLRSTDFLFFWINTYCLLCVIKNKIINKLIAMSCVRQVQFLSFVFQKLLSIVMDAGKSAMICCDVKVNVIMTLFVTCRFADVIENMT